MLSRRVLATASELAYLFLILLTVVATGLSCTAILSQAVRTSPSQSWTDNVNALMIGASYLIVLVASLIFCVKRRIAVRLKLSRISKTYRTIGRDDLPASVHRHVLQEYIRTCLIAYESQPKNIHRDGWGRPGEHVFQDRGLCCVVSYRIRALTKRICRDLGSKYSGISFRRTLLDTIPRIDELAHLVIPLHPKLKPHARMLHHFRFLTPLLPKDEDGMTPLIYYDSAIQIARHSAQELTEEEFEIGMKAAYEIEKCLNDCRLEMLESESSTQLNEQQPSGSKS
ncbi:hypothetical protein CVT26_004380 [Gymnopilus dilepis]|uniref:Defect at low temperature protein 1 n=1 Tax=Gymnopilus dilepis TaxID=231916 RepID=A0A409WE03_9AGAR|nr:hypothetical protein CVT26_004380 [Gymnopilus dilepis]